jgi:hypothetical protein
MAVSVVSFESWNETGEINTPKTSSYTKRVREEFHPNETEKKVQK